MIKKLDILLVRSFVGPFVVTFFITLFVLVMQFFWLYMDELIGKGFGIWVLLQLLFYMSTTMVPLALPLSVLLSSIMTFGNMGENFELVAIKSSGISLLRFMRPLFIFVVGIAGGAFLFNNNVIPVANLKALSLLYDLRNSKPTLNIRPDQFNREIEGYSIRVGSKDKDGQTIHNIVIYDHTGGVGNEQLILAKSGAMVPSADKQSLVFKLHDGWRYQEDNENNIQNFSQTRTHFGTWDKVFDLSSFRLTRTNEELFKNAYQMMNEAQLRESIDSIQRTRERSPNNVSAYMNPYVTWVNAGNEKKQLVKDIGSNKYTLANYKDNFLQAIPDSLRDRVLQTATSNIRNVKGLMDVCATDQKIQTENYLKYAIEWHRKFTLSFACILLFLIGAPLGAIIRKGGLGMPLVLAVSFFVFYHIMSITGEKLAKSESLPPWGGMWLSTAILLPVALLLIIQARNDSQIFSKEWYTRIWRRTRDVFTSKKNKLIDQPA